MKVEPTEGEGDAPPAELFVVDGKGGDAPPALATVKKEEMDGQATPGEARGGEMAAPIEASTTNAEAGADGAEEATPDGARGGGLSASSKASPTNAEAELDVPGPNTPDEARANELAAQLAATSTTKGKAEDDEAEGDDDIEVGGVAPVAAKADKPPVTDKGYSAVIGIFAALGNPAKH